MAKFRVGDKVRLTEAGAKRLNDSWRFDEDARGNFVAGAIGTVEANEETDSFGRLLVRFDGLRYPKFGDTPDANVDEGWNVYDSDVELIASSFQPGDKVRIKASVTDDDLHRIGIYDHARINDMRSGGVVSEVLDDFIGEPWVSLRNGFNVKNEMLELVDESSTTPRIDVGSRVKIVKNVFGPIGEKYVGKTGTVVINDYAPIMPYKVRLDDGRSVGCAAEEIEPYVESDVVLSKPGDHVVHIDEERIKRWIVEGRREVGDDEFTRRSGDALVLVVPGGKAYVYRLDAISEPNKTKFNVGDRVVVPMCDGKVAGTITDVFAHSGYGVTLDAVYYEEQEIESLYPAKGGVSNDG